MEKLSSETLQRINDFSENLKVVREDIAEAAFKVNKDRSQITLLAATKTVPVEIVRYAISQGIDCIGENRAQELLDKYPAMKDENCSIHMIGHLQTNKVKKIVGKVDMIQSVDSCHLAEEIGKHSRDQGKVTDVLVEVNIGKEQNKSGVFPEELYEFIHKIVKINGINIRGLMTIPPICETKCEIRKYFSKMYKLFVDIGAKKLDNVSMDILSMGMSSDYTEAILEGATMIRVGSALFGSRNYSL